MSTAEDVRRFLVDDLGADAAELRDETPLMETGIVDSLKLFELVTFLEDEYGIEVADEELLPQNFGTITAIAQMVAAKRQAS
jgi:acyl carrier protein